MTKEELEKEAEEWLSITDNHLNDERTHFLSESEYAERAYLAGAEPREKYIAELEAQIKKMQDDIDCLTFACENYREEMEKNLADATELEKENAELKADNDARKFAMAMSEKVEKQLREENTKLKDVIEGYKKIAKWCDKCELEKKISILLSCKNCPENKGGLICQKEYEDKCLAQKIEFIKELQKENAELKSENQKWKDGIALKDEEIGCIETEFNTFKFEAKEIIREFVEWATWQGSNCPNFKSIQDKAEQFLNSEVEK